MSLERAAYQAAWYRDHRATVRARAAAKYLEHRDERRAKSAAYNRSHRAEHAAYYAERRAAKRAWQAAYNAEHRDERLAYMTVYNAGRRPQRYEVEHRRRARKAGNGVFVVTARDWRRMLHRYGHACAYCGSKRGLTQEHVVPLSRGGRHSIGNLVPACGRCNSSKGPRLLIEWRSRVRAAA